MWNVFKPCSGNIQIRQLCVISNDVPYSIDGLLMEALMAVKMIKNHETFSKAVKEYRTMMYQSLNNL